MAIRQIFMDGDPILLKTSREVTVFDGRLAQLLDDLNDTMAKADGAGLAAVQVGILRRAAVIDADGQKLELVNPEIIEVCGEQIGTEGCLSVDSSRNCDVARPEKVTVRAFDRYGKQFEAAVEGLAARAVCHEMDHMDGILFYTREYKGQ